MKIDRLQIYNKCEGHCAYCGKEIMIKDMQVDHCYPKRLDNLYEWSEEVKNQRPSDIDNFNNLMPSCRRCNHYKRANTMEVFREMMQTLHERIEKIYIVKLAIKYGIVAIIPFDGVFYFEKYNANKQ